MPYEQLKPEQLPNRLMVCKQRAPPTQHRAEPRQAGPSHQPFEQQRRVQLQPKPRRCRPRPLSRIGQPGHGKSIIHKQGMSTAQCSYPCSARFPATPPREARVVSRPATPLLSSGCTGHPCTKIQHTMTMWPPNHALSSPKLPIDLRGGRGERGEGAHERHFAEEDAHELPSRQVFFFFVD
jgi:hypothetical protein